MKIYPNTSILQVSETGSAIFLFVENKFNQWLKASNPANEYEEKYFGEEAIASRKGAIVDALEAAITEADETGKPVDMGRFDYDAVFAC